MFAALPARKARVRRTAAGHAIAARTLSQAHAKRRPREIARETLSVFVGSWNMGDAPLPPSLAPWLPPGGQHDLYAVATQECAASREIQGHMLEL